MLCQQFQNFFPSWKCFDFKQKQILFKLFLGNNFKLRKFLLFNFTSLFQFCAIFFMNFSLWNILHYTKKFLKLIFPINSRWFNVSSTRQLLITQPSFFLRSSIFKPPREFCALNVYAEIKWQNISDWNDCRRRHNAKL